VTRSKFLRSCLGTQGMWRIVSLEVVFSSIFFGKRASPLSGLEIFYASLVFYVDTSMAKERFSTKSTVLTTLLIIDQGVNWQSRPLSRGAGPEAHAQK
jgi:hypothetical protein